MRQTGLETRLRRRLRSEWAGLIRLLSLIGWRREAGSRVRPGVVISPGRRPSRDA